MEGQGERRGKGLLIGGIFLGRITVFGRGIFVVFIVFTVVIV